MAQKSRRLMFRFWLDIFKPEEAKIVDTIEDLKSDRSFTQTIRDGIRLICDLRDGKLDVLFELFPWVKAEFIEYIREVQPVPTEKNRGNELPEEPKPVVQQTPQQVHAEKQWLEAEQERLEAERAWHENRMRDAEKALAVEREKIESERRQTQSLLQQQLERLEKLLLQQGNKPIPGGLKPINNETDEVLSTVQGINTMNVPQFSAPTYDDEDEDLALEVTKAKGNGNSTQNFLKSMQALQ